jgi:hypothetical protein
MKHFITHFNTKVKKLGSKKRIVSDRLKDIFIITVIDGELSDVVI